MLTKSLKGKFVEVHLDGHSWPKAEGEDRSSWDAYKVERTEKTADGKEYPVVIGVVAGDDERGLSIVDRETGKQLACVVPSMRNRNIYWIRSLDDIWYALQDMAASGVYKFSESEKYQYGERRMLLGRMSPCPFS